MSAQPQQPLSNTSFTNVQALALHSAIRSGNLAELRKQVKQLSQQQRRSSNSKQQPSSSSSSASAHKPTLLEALQTRDRHGRTPFHVAAEQGKLDAIKYLLRKLPVPPSQAYDLVHAEDKQGWTPLHVACSLPNVRLVHFLLHNSYCPSEHAPKTINLSIPLHYLVRHDFPAPPVSSSAAASGASPSSSSGSIRSFSFSLSPSSSSSALHSPSSSSDATQQQENSSPKESKERKEEVKLFWALMDELMTGNCVNTANNAGDTPLHSAVSLGNNVHVVAMLLQKGAQLDATNNLGETPLHRAVMTQKEQMVETLLAWGADPNRAKSQLGSPKEVAVQVGNKNILALFELYDKPGTLAKPPVTDQQSKRWSRGSRKSAKAIATAASPPPSPSSASSSSSTPSNAKSLSLEAMAFISKLDSKKDRHGRPPLLIAVEAGKYEAVSHLLHNTKREDLTLTDRNGWNALHVACSCGHLSIIDLLINNNVCPFSVNATSVDLSTPLHYMVRLKPPPPDPAKKQKKAASEHKTSLERRSLGFHRAAVYDEDKFFSLMRQLLGFKHSNVNAANRNGDTPLHTVASKAHSLKILKFLLHHGANVNSVNKFGESCLHMAVRSGDSKFVRKLLAHGANPTLMGAQGTPIDVARISNLPRIVRLLKEQAEDMVNSASVDTDSGSESLASDLSFGGDDFCSSSSSPSDIDEYFGGVPGLQAASVSRKASGVSFKIPAASQASASAAPPSAATPNPSPPSSLASSLSSSLTWSSASEDIPKKTGPTGRPLSRKASVSLLSLATVEADKEPDFEPNADVLTLYGKMKPEASRKKDEAPNGQEATENEKKKEDRKGDEESSTAIKDKKTTEKTVIEEAETTPKEKDGASSDVEISPEKDYEEMLVVLQQLGIAQYEPMFKEEAIGMRALQLLTDEDLKSLGIKLGHRRVLLDYLKEQKKKKKKEKEKKKMEMEAEEESRHNNNDKSNSRRRRRRRRTNEETPSGSCITGAECKPSISLADVTIEEPLGRGAHGSVYKGKLRGMTTVAVKKLVGVNKQSYLREAYIMEQIPNHPNVVTMYGMAESEQALFIVVEYVPGGSVHDFLRSHEGKLSVATLLGMAKDVVTGMEHLHSNNIVHRDLASRNLLLETYSVNCYRVKVCDFGLSRAIDEYYQCKTENAQVAIKWTAPEALRFQKFTSQSDVWRFSSRFYASPFSAILSFSAIVF
ncbi:Serine/threonine-protein kinase, variant 2 [Balamuthia mandrillaris]